MWKAIPQDQILHRVGVVLGNLKRLALLILQCVAEKAFGVAPIRLGITSMMIYVSLCVVCSI